MKIKSFFFLPLILFTSTVSSQSTSTDGGYEIRKIPLDNGVIATIRCNYTYDDFDGDGVLSWNTQGILKVSNNLSERIDLYYFMNYDAERGRSCSSKIFMGSKYTGINAGSSKVFCGNGNSYESFTAFTFFNKNRKILPNEFSLKWDIQYPDRQQEVLTASSKPVRNADGLTESEFTRYNSFIEKGNKAKNNQNYEDAIAYFTAAYQIKPSSDLQSFIDRMEQRLSQQQKPKEESKRNGYVTTDGSYIAKTAPITVKQPSIVLNDKKDNSVTSKNNDRTKTDKQRAQVLIQEARNVGSGNGDWQKAIILLEKAKELDPDNPIIDKYIKDNRKFLVVKTDMGNQGEISYSNSPWLDEQSQNILTEIIVGLLSSKNTNSSTFNKTQLDWWYEDYDETNARYVKEDLEEWYTKKNYDALDDLVNGVFAYKSRNTNNLPGGYDARVHLDLLYSWTYQIPYEPKTNKQKSDYFEGLYQLSDYYDDTLLDKLTTIKFLKFAYEYGYCVGKGAVSEFTMEETIPSLLKTGYGKGKTKKYLKNISKNCDCDKVFESHRKKRNDFFQYGSRIKL